MGGSPEGWGPRRVGGPKFRAFFSLSAAKLVLSSLSGGLLVEFWWCLKRRGAQMCTFGLSGCRVRAPAAPRAVRGRAVVGKGGLGKGGPGEGRPWGRAALGKGGRSVHESKEYIVRVVILESRDTFRENHEQKTGRASQLGGVKPNPPFNPSPPLNHIRNPLPFNPRPPLPPSTPPPPQPPL